MVENAGHGASVMALKAIGGHRRIQPGNHNAAPVIVVLAGHTQVGLYALAAARHLANRTCHVYALVSPRDPAEGSLEAIQRKCAEFSGVRLIHSVQGNYINTGFLTKCLIFFEKIKICLRKTPRPWILSWMV